MDTVEFFWDYSPREQGNFTFNELDFFSNGLFLTSVAPSSFVHIFEVPGKALLKKFNYMNS